MKKILILTNNAGGLINFRKELLEKFIAERYDVFISVPYDEKIESIEKIGCKVIDTPINRRDFSIFQELKLLKHYNKIINLIKPDIILTYTIKPNIYGGLVARKNKIPYLTNITGLGSALIHSSNLQKILIYLYKKSIKNARTVFFQNEKNKQFFTNNNILNGKHEILPGSGVNLQTFQLLEYPKKNTIEFVFISRIMKEKGIEEYLEAAEYITLKYPNIKFHICGSFEESYREIILENESKGIIKYHGMVKNISKILKNIHCVIHPSYHEGMSNVLLEAAASGRPVIASDIPGCKETLDDGQTGFSFPKKDTKKLIQTIEKFISLKNDEKKKMGIEGRKKMEKEFKRERVIEKYLEEIQGAMEGQ